MPTIPGTVVNVTAPAPEPIQTLTADVAAAIPLSTPPANPASPGTVQGVATASAPLLPIRGEKRIMTSYYPVGQGVDIEQSDTLLESDSFFIKAAKDAFKDYIVVRIPHRGSDAKGNPDPTTAAEFRFLINPTTVSISRETVDYQAFTRAGWQFGIWGEGLLRISMSGSSAGAYFATGLTDEFAYLSQSYRNLQQLVMFYENNGYWYEGEQAQKGPLAADFSRRRIKCHQDVELMVGNFLWSGMFDALTIRNDAETPFVLRFDLSFLAWKERYRAGSPYNNPIANPVQRGHVYGVQQNFGQGAVQQGAAKLAASLPSLFNAPPVIPTLANVNANSAAIKAAQAEDRTPPMVVTGSDTNFNDPMFSPEKFFG